MINSAVLEKIRSRRKKVNVFLKKDALSITAESVHDKKKKLYKRK